MSAILLCVSALQLCYSVADAHAGTCSSERNTQGEWEAGGFDGDLVAILDRAFSLASMTGSVPFAGIRCSHGLRVRPKFILTTSQLKDGWTMSPFTCTRSAKSCPDCDLGEC